MNIFSLPSTEEEAVAFLQEKGILPSERICPNNHKMKLYFGQEMFWKCNVKSCKKKVNIRTGTHTQTVERMWGSAKWRNKKHRGTTRHHLESYLAEFMWRKHVADSDVSKGLLEAIVTFWPPESQMQ